MKFFTISFRSKARNNKYCKKNVTVIDADKLVPEGIEGRVAYKGLVIKVIDQLKQANATRISIAESD